MDRSELQKERAMNYIELVEHLQNKYGIPNRAYFRTESCKSKSPIMRTDEGLFVHHVKEMIRPKLSNPKVATMCPWEWQQPENLCYCNYLEHLLLHVCINLDKCERSGKLVSDGLVCCIIPELEDYYARRPVYTEKNVVWRNAVNKVIEDNQQDFEEIVADWKAKINKYIEKPKEAKKPATSSDNIENDISTGCFGCFCVMSFVGVLVAIGFVAISLLTMIFS